MAMKTDLDEAFEGTCENCKATNVWVRRMESQVSDFGGAGRGFFNICFSCAKPVRIWMGPRGETHSPLDWTKEEIETYLTKNRRPVAWQTLGEPKHIDEGREDFHR